jgi:hypothetical protein
MEEIIGRYPYLFPAFFAAFWCFVLSILARLSGWTHLATFYRSEDSFEGAKRHFQSMSMGRGGLMDTNFSNCVTFGVDQRVFRLSMFLLFRPFHPPLSIPLSDLSATRRKFLFFRMVRIHTSRAPGIRMTIRESQARWIEENSGGAWVLPADDHVESEAHAGTT